MNLQNLDFTPLWITMKTGVAATFVSFFLGIFAARFVMGRKGKARAFWDGFLTMPLVLPPTVAGYILLRTFSTRRPLPPAHSQARYVLPECQDCSPENGQTVFLY